MKDYLSNKDEFIIGPAVPLLNYHFDPSLHPRDARGRFTTTYGIQKNAQALTTLDGHGFFAPPGADFKAVYEAGKKNGIAGAASAISQCGKFDFQRNEGTGYSDTKPNVFYPAYTDASNYAVGVYMRGAGCSKSTMDHLGKAYAWAKSSIAGDPRQQAMWDRGWEDAGKKYSQ